ncbi:hypothetical protein [Sphingobium sp. CAP-1]|uniref:hypothetical protein n=1 Tax=Sphingobium sp. CAP-1 TaxID=2676077 RepID=UPI0012BB1FC9|nr:hypothetical protein [Sphingobium sp. CAP-1]QGP78900.1 hypothetical protein GL174_07770 [Sphingobium sp. CAP-1]
MIHRHTEGGLKGGFMSDSLTSKALSAHDETFGKAERLITAHTKRTPEFDNIHATLAQLHAIDLPPLLGMRSLHRARLNFAIEKVDVAAAHLAEDMEQDDADLAANRAEFALHMARELSLGKRRSVNYEVADTRAAFDALFRAASRHSDDHGLVVEIHRRLTMKKEMEALKLATGLIKREPDYLEEAIDIVRRVYRRPYRPKIAAKVEHILAPLQDSPVGEVLADHIFARKLEAQVRAARIQTDGVVEDGPSLTEVQRFLDQRGAAGARALVRLKDLFLSVFPDDEEIKLAIVEEYSRFALETQLTDVAKRMLECAAQTRKFWQDDGFRTDILAKMRLACTDESIGENCFLLGVDHFLSGSDRFVGYFSKSAMLVAQLALSGASSLFDNLDETDEHGLDRIETSFRDVSRVAAAYICCADLGYFARYAKAYAASARAVGGSVRLHFHIAAPTWEEAAAAVAAELADFDDISFSWERPAFALPAYYASMRFLRAEDFLRHVAEQVVLTDIDVTFTKSPDAFLKHLSDSDCDVAFRIYDRVRTVRQAVKPWGLIYRYPRLLPWSVVNAACLYLSDRNHSIVARQVAQDMRRYLGRAIRTKDSAWWVDQNSLYTSLQTVKSREDVRIANIEDNGLPFGSFDYDGSVAFAGSHPNFTHLQGASHASLGLYGRIRRFFRNGKMLRFVR